MKPEALIDPTAEIFDVSREHLTGARRARQYCRPRFAYYLVAHEESDASLPVIGRALGGRDHTTVLHGLRRAAYLIEKDVEFALNVQSLRRFAKEHKATLVTRLNAGEEVKRSQRREVLMRTRHYVMRSLERLAIENPAGFDRLIAQAGSYDPKNYL